MRQLFVDRRGRLWVLSESGQVAFIHDGQVKMFDATDGVPPNGLQAPVEDAQGRIWFSVCADEGCFHFDGERFINGMASNAPPAGQFQELAFDSDGTLSAAATVC